MMSGRRVLVCLMALCGILGLLLLINDDAYTELVFSEESGFYEEPFELEIYAPPGTQIFYTLDGSEPDENAILYTGPIRIDDATQNENVYSMRTDVSSGFLSDEIAIYSADDPQYIVPDYNVDKCTVVRSAYRNTDGDFSEIKTKCYFVGYNEKLGYDNIYIISIVTAPDNLFGYETGIYVLGHVYDEYIENNHETLNTNWAWWEANYRQHGFEWERAANIQIFDSERTLLLNKNCGIRLQGDGSRGLLPRSINIYARDQYDDEGRFYIDLFDTGYIADTITLFAGGDDSSTNFRDMLASRLVSGRNFATMHYIPCAMFLDGEYWGVYWLTEKYNSVYLGCYYNVDNNNIIMIKGGSAAEGEDNYELYTQMIDHLYIADLSIDENYQYACELIDIQSYIDYYAAEIYIGRSVDWPGSNEGLWRVIETGDGEYEDGRWRWMLYDVNSSSLASHCISLDNLSSTMDKSQMFYNLCQNEDFKKQFTTTFMDLVNTSFTEENVNSIISEQSALMETPTAVHLKRFHGTEGTHKYIDGVSDIQNFFDQRKPYILQYLKDDLGLTGTLALVELEINDTASGSVILNSIEPSFGDDGTWNGEYFTDYPVTLTAAANDGYRFVRWECDTLPESENTEETVTLSVAEGGTTIKAIFEKKE